MELSARVYSTIGASSCGVTAIMCANVATSASTTAVVTMTCMARAVSTVMCPPASAPPVDDGGTLLCCSTEPTSAASGVPTDGTAALGVMADAGVCGVSGAATLRGSCCDAGVAAWSSLTAVSPHCSPFIGLAWLDDGRFSS